VQLENGDDQTGLGDAHPDDPFDGLGRFFGNAAFDAFFKALRGFHNTGVETLNGFSHTSVKAFNIVVRRQVDAGLPVGEGICQNRSGLFSCSGGNLTSSRNLCASFNVSKATASIISPYQGFDYTIYGVFVPAKHKYLFG
jgi:hypothetical protein